MAEFRDAEDEARWDRLWLEFATLQLSRDRLVRAKDERWLDEFCPGWVDIDRPAWRD